MGQNGVVSLRMPRNERRKWGMSYNERFMALFIHEMNLEAKARLQHWRISSQPLKLSTSRPSSLSPVNKLEKKLKHKRRRAVIHSLEDKEASLDHEDSPKQGRMIEEIDKDKNVNLVQSSEQGEAYETVEHRMDFSTAFPQIDDDETLAETLLNIKRSAAKDKGKAIMQESKSPKKIKKKKMM
nr:hypothetical protein [Tanacetum cinerariifolium]